MEYIGGRPIATWSILEGVLYGVYWRVSCMEYIRGCPVWSILEGVLQSILKGVLYGVH